MEILTLSIGLGAHKFKQNFLVCRNLRTPLILGLDFYYKFHICTSWDSDRKHFLHIDRKPIVYIRTQKSLAIIYTIRYQEIQPYTFMIIKAKLDPPTTDDQDNYLLTADSTFIYNNPNIKYHPTIINSNNVCKNSNLPLNLTNNSDYKICIPCNITIGTSETIYKLNYNINEITFNTTSDTPFQNAYTIEPILNDHKPQDDINAELHPQSDHANKSNSHHNKK